MVFTLFCLCMFQFGVNAGKASAETYQLHPNKWEAVRIPTVQGLTYNLNVAKDSVISLEMKNDVNAKWEMVLSNNKSKELLDITSTTYMLDGAFTKKEIGLAKGNYTVQIKGSWGNFDQLVGMFRAKVSANSNYEKEDNTLLKDANKISLNKTYYGNIPNANDRDSFNFILAADSKVKFDLSNKKNVIWEAVVYDQYEREYQRIKSSDATSSGNASAEIGLSKGKYYLVIRQADSHKYDNERYNFKVSTQTNQNVEQEENNSVGTATKITLSKGYEGIISSSNDYDYYRVEVPTNNIYTTFMISNNKSAKWNVAIYNEFSGVIYDKFNSKSGSKAKGNSTYSINLPKGVYYVRVADNKNAIGSKYTVKVITTAKSSALSTKKIKVKNAKGAKDTLVVKGTSNKDIIRIYNAKGKLIKKTTVKGNSVSISKLNLGKKAGQIKISIQKLGKLESTKTTVKFSKE